MNEKDLLEFLENEGISNNFFEIVNEPEFSTKELNYFENSYNLNTAELLEKNDEELIANYGLDNESILEWKIAYDNFKFYKGELSEINKINKASESKELYISDMDNLETKLTSYTIINESKKEGDFAPSFLFWASYQMVYFQTFQWMVKQPHI